MISRGPVYLGLDDLLEAEVDEVSASDIIPGSCSKSAALRLTPRLLLLPEEEEDGVWVGDVLGLARRPSLKKSQKVSTNNVNESLGNFNCDYQGNIEHIPVFTEWLSLECEDLLAFPDALPPLLVGLPEGLLNLVDEVSTSDMIPGSSSKRYGVWW